MAASKRWDVLVVGAGLCGIMAGRTLEERGLSVRLLDKGRSVGGRLATRRVGEGLADHGAQFVTAETPAFKKILEAWKREGLLRVWSTGWSNGSITNGHTEALVRHVSPAGMNGLAKSLAEGLDAYVGCRIASAETTEEGWRLRDEEGGIHEGRALVLTPPVPQSLALLEAGAVELAAGDARALRRIEYDPCLTALFRIDGDVDIPEPGLVERAGADLSWLVDNVMKGISSGARVLTLQAGPAYSARRYDDADGDVLDELEERAQPYLAQNAVVRERQLKRWRYAVPAVLHPRRLLELQGVAPCVCAGDAFGGLRVEGATLSGIEAAKTVAERLGASS
jgi:hypothetical protein